MNNRLYVMRGCPGSGKSFLAHSLVEDVLPWGETACIASADDYFMVRENGRPVYQFDPTGLLAAHMTCQRRTEEALRFGVNVVVVDNTNVRIKDFEIYRWLGMCYGYDVKVVEPKTPWWLAVKPLLGDGEKDRKALEPFAREFAARNSHGVTEATVMRMLTRWQPYPGDSTLA